MAAQTKSLDLELSSSQYAFVADSASLSFVGDFTFEGMFNIETFGINQNLMSKWVAGNRSYRIYLDSTDDLIITYSGDGTNGTTIRTTVPLDSVFPTGRWVHIAVAVDVSAKLAYVYINGKLQTMDAASGTQTAVYDGAADFNIGAVDEGAAEFYDGKVMNARLWSDIRTQKEVIQFMGGNATGEANLISQWLFNDDYVDTEGTNNLAGGGTPVFASDVANTLGIKDVANWTLLESIDIDISSLSLSADLDLYPVNIVSLDSATYAGLESDGKDLRFTTDKAGLYEVPHELVSIDTSGETIQAWVLLPTFTYDASFTALYVWGTNSGATGYAATDIMGGQSAWKAEYKLVQHQDADSDDSTVNGNDGVEANMTHVTGKIGDGGDFNGTNAGMTVSDAASIRFGTGDFSIDYWLNVDALPGSGSDSLWNKDPNGTKYFANIRDTGVIFYRGLITTGDFDFSGSLSEDTWYKITQTRTAGGVVKNYINGVQDSTESGTNINLDTVGTDLTFGSANTYWFSGILDEARLSAEALSADWVKTDHNLQNDPSTYITNTAVSGAGGTGMFLSF